jgi:hypothetical protein
VSVPGSSAAVAFLARHLQRLAAGAGYPARPEQWWIEPRDKAWAHKHANRGRRRPAPRSVALKEASEPLERVIGTLTESDAFTLEVHRAVTAPHHPGAGAHGSLPPYLERPHDHRRVCCIRR